MMMMMEDYLFAHSLHNGKTLVCEQELNLDGMLRFAVAAYG